VLSWVCSALSVNSVVIEVASLVIEHSGSLEGPELIFSPRNLQQRLVTTTQLGTQLLASCLVIIAMLMRARWI
jgi:hypothetical protein